MPCQPYRQQLRRGDRLQQPSRFPRSPNSARPHLARLRSDGDELLVQTELAIDLSTDKRFLTFMGDLSAVDQPEPPARRERPADVAFDDPPVSEPAYVVQAGRGLGQSCSGGLSDRQQRPPPPCRGRPRPTCRSSSPTWSANLTVKVNDDHGEGVRIRNRVVAITVGAATLRADEAFKTCAPPGFAELAPAAIVSARCFKIALLF